jgi:hypothetical protein
MKFRVGAISSLIIVMTLSGCISDDNPAIDPVIEEIHLDVETREVDGIYFWEMKFEVDRDLSRSLGKATWSQVTVEVEGADGTVLIPQSEPELMPDARPDSEGIYYLPNAPGDSIEPSDVLVVTGITKAFNDCVVRMYKGDKLVAESTPTSNFPPLSLWVKMGDTVTSNWFYNDSIFWEVEIPIDGVSPLGEEVNWSEVMAQIVDTGTSAMLVESNLSENPGTYMYDQWIELTDLNGEGRVDSNDSLEITNLTKTFENKTVQLLVNGSVVGSVHINAEFPLDNARASLWEYHINEYEVANETFWYVNVSISMEPRNVEFEWSELEVRVVDKEVVPEDVLIERGTPLIYTGPPGNTSDVWYVDTNYDKDIVNSRDIIKVTGMNQSFSNSTIEIWFDGRAVGSLMLPHNLNGTDYGNTTINFGTPIVDPVQINSTIVWYVTLNIFKISPKNVKVFWEDVRIEIVQSTGSVLIHPRPLKEDIWMFPDYDMDDSDGIDVETWYIETTAGDNKMSAGDVFKLTGLTIFYEEATVNFYLKGHLAGSSRLASNFP